MASGFGYILPWPLDPYGGPPAEQDGFYQGNTGILMGKAPWSRLFAAWRLLHGMEVGVAAGKGLAAPCCDPPEAALDESKKRWVAARVAVPGVTKLEDYQILTYRSVGDFLSVPTCFADAFATATQTLNDRITRYGVTDPSVKAWLDGQDKVFTACNEDATLPSLDAGAPAWLKSDRAYQDAALALYSRHFDDAERKFTAIADDSTSPWRKLGRYLAARAAVTAALPTAQPAAFQHARQTLSALSPPDAVGHADLARLTGALDFRDRPDIRRRALTAILTAPTLDGNAGADFKDARRLGQSPQGTPAFLDWISTFGRTPDKPEATWFDHYDVDQIWHTDAETLAHARAQWQTTRDPAWLIAAMEWSDPSQAAADLVKEAEGIPTGHPAFLTALYHRIRLAGFTDIELSRRTLDAALIRPDLSLTTRNLLIAERVMMSRDLNELARFAPRDSPCVSAGGEERGCLAGDYRLENPTLLVQKPAVMFGEDAAVIIDRLPIQSRAKLSDIDTLPAPLRLDVALTTWVRAVLAQDLVTADRLAASLRTLLPQLEPEWRAYLAAKQGEDKQFAGWLILAKLPGADVDLGEGYTRPQGTVAEFDGHWHDWLYAAGNPTSVNAPSIEHDLVCFGMCGPGAFPMRLPAFVSSETERSARDRGRFQPADAKTARSVWEELLSYAKAHPDDPRSPEALYWLVRVSHYGTGHNRSSYRAFVLLHNRYSKSHWASDSKYFYD